MSVTLFSHDPESTRIRMYQECFSKCTTVAMQSHQARNIRTPIYKDSMCLFLGLLPCMILTMLCTFTVYKMVYIQESEYQA